MFMSVEMWSHLKDDSMVKVCPGLRLGLNTAQGTDRNPGSRSEKACSFPARNLWRTAGNENREPKTWWFLQQDLQRWYKADSLRASTRGKVTVRRKMTWFPFRGCWGLGEAHIVHGQPAQLWFWPTNACWNPIQPKVFKRHFDPLK